MSVKKSSFWAWGLFLFAAGILIGFTSNPHNPLNHKEETAEVTSPYGVGAVYCELSTEQFSVRLAPDKTKELIEIINQMGLNKYPADDDREHNGDYPYLIILHFGNPESTLDIHFNSDFSQMWTSDSREDKNSLTYQIDNSEDIEAFFEKWENNFQD